MIQKLYTYVGCTTALRFYINRSTASDKATALEACEALNGVGESLLEAVSNNTSEEAFKELCEAHVITVLEAIETLRSTSVNQEFNDTFLSLLEYFYTAADALAGGGGGTPLTSSWGPVPKIPQV
jgi:cobalamin biosynthesis protein CbiD